jgi:hypothetical protein
VPWLIYSSPPLLRPRAVELLNRPESAIVADVPPELITTGAAFAADTNPPANASAIHVFLKLIFILMLLVKLKF